MTNKEILEKHSKAVAKANLEYAIKLLENFPIEKALEFLREELKKNSWVN